MVDASLPRELLLALHVQGGLAELAGEEVGGGPDLHLALADGWLLLLRLLLLLALPRAANLLLGYSSGLGSWVAS